jgi:hypothetical protein
MVAFHSNQAALRIIKETDIQIAPVLMLLKQGIKIGEDRGRM